jgi:hypothetical protein
MTLFETNERLIRLRTENPGLWNDLQTKSTCDYCPGDHDEVAEDLEPHDNEEMGEDDSEIPTREVVHHIVTKKTATNRKMKGKGMVGLVSSGEAEDTDAEVAAVKIVGEPKTEGSGKCTHRTNAKYTDFWRHANDKDEDLEVPGL